MTQKNAEEKMGQRGRWVKGAGVRHRGSGDKKGKKKIKPTRNSFQTNTLRVDPGSAAEEYTDRASQEKK